MAKTASRLLLDAELAGLDALERADAIRPQSPLRRVWQGFWPKLAALVIAVFAWQLVVWSRWRPDYVLPGPATVARELSHQVGQGEFWRAVTTTLRRGLTGYVLAVVIGTVLGLAVARVRAARTAIGSLVTGLQSMPSIAWFPFAILLFKLSESAILFVVVLGAAPSVANGLIAGIDQIPPLHLRAGRVLGAKRWTMYRYVILPAAFPGFVAGLKQGWGFAWRSLMAGELLVIIKGHQSVGVLMQNARDLSDTPALMAEMIVILVIGIVVDAVVFAGIERTIRRRRGLLVT